MGREGDGLRQYYVSHINELTLQLRQKMHNLNRLEAQRNDYNARVRMLKEELQLLQEPGSYVGEVVKVMGKKKVLVKIHPEGKYVVDIDKNIDITKITPSTRVALRNDSYVLHLILPSKVDPLVNLMKVEKVPDSTYDMIGGLDQQIKEIKEGQYKNDYMGLEFDNVSPLFPPITGKEILTEKFQIDLSWNKWWNAAMVFAFFFAYRIIFFMNIKLNEQATPYIRACLTRKTTQQKVQQQPAKSLISAKHLLSN